ncbi:hypothetical protein ACRQU7_05495 [Caproiciproducens sp. R1]|uniref:hypothetical protein n=1 Tax=Caproiciproducens sp. R1 TaxID=3435000 RepID=UPI004033A77E
MIKAWTESVVRISLVRAEKAQFYKDGSKRKISKNKDFYEISSDVLFAEDSGNKTFCPFTLQAVKSGPDINILYYKLGDKVVEDNREKKRQPL